MDGEGSYNGDICSASSLHPRWNEGNGRWKEVGRQERREGWKNHKSIQEGYIASSFNLIGGISCLKKSETGSNDIN